MSWHTPFKRLTKEGQRQVDRTRLYAETFLTYAGESELCGEPYEVSPWLYKNFWRPVFGTGSVNKRTGRWMRQYRRVLLGVHRGYGKSQVAACIVMTIADMDPLPNGMYGIVADSRENTKMVKDYIKTMIRARKELSDRWKVYKDVIRNEQTGQEIHVFPYKEAALQGKHFHVLVGDEIHVWRDSLVWDAAVSGQAKIPNAMTIGITTAGLSRDGFLFKLYKKLKKDPFAYVCWLGINDSDNPEDRRCWKKITAAGRITMAELEEQFQALPLSQFVRYYLNRTPMDDEEEPFMRRSWVERCARVEREIDWDEWFCVGLDGAVSGDTLAVVAAQRQGEDWAFREWCWEKPPESGVYDLTDVADVLQMLAEKDGSPLICLDIARMQFLKNWLYRERGMELTPFPQSPSVMCPASELLAMAVKNGHAALADTPVLAQHCINAKTAESKAYGRRLASDKHGQGTKRIDAAVAAAMAMSAYDNNEPETPSVWTLSL